ncbi:FxsA family protein [Halopenitus persicus]|uniref:FxsA family protein n=1 Tax=Halopenitus persicus TaxID=1048396 RepID=UPI000BBA90D9|nr:FxsA family protein [Halopenitus persicus]
MRLRYLIALLLLIPLADALFLVVVADHLGWQLTVALVVLTALLGMLLVRAEGRHTLARLQRKAARGEPPTNELLDGALLITAGAFLLTPGLVTDAIGFLLAFPPTRIPIRAVTKRFVLVPYLDRRTDGFLSGNVYIGGFPDGDEFGGAGGGAFGGGFGGSGGGFGGATQPGASDETEDGSAADGPGPRSGSSPGAGSGTDRGDDDVVDVDYTVEDGTDEEPADDETRSTDDR